MIVTTFWFVLNTENWPVWKAEGEKLKTRGSEEELSVLFAEVIVARDLVAELTDHVNGGGQQVVELGDASSLHRDQPVLGLQLLLLHLYILKWDIMSQINHQSILSLALKIVCMN